MPILPTGRIAAAAGLAASVLALAPASGGAATTTFGSDLTAAANVVEARQADTAYWQAAFAGGRSPLAPAAGQIRSFRLKGIALSDPVVGVPGGERMFHLQALRPVAGGRFQILRTSQGFELPPRTADPQTITTYTPENFCVDAGDVLVFNTVGGWDGIVNQTGPYPGGTPLQIFSAVPGATVSEYTGADKTNNGDHIAADPARGQGHELLMQLTVGSGPDATPLCPGGTAGTAGPMPPPPSAPGGAPSVQKAMLFSQRVTVSSKGKLTVSLRCRAGASRCAGTLQVMTRAGRATSLGSAKFDIEASKTGRATIQLGKRGRSLLAKGRGRLAVKLAAETKPGGAARRSSLHVTLRRR